MLCVLSAFCVNGQVSLREAFDLLIADAETLLFPSAF